MYKGPAPKTIDGPFLSRILYYINSQMPKHSKICLLGGSALTYLGLRKAGSEDVDVLAINNGGDLNEAMSKVNRLIAERKVFIEITKKG